MDELSLGLECLAENEANEDAAAESATTTANPVRSGSLTFAHEPIHLKRNSLDASGSTNKIIGALPRPASIEFTPVGAAKCGRKGRLSMYISGGVDTVTGIATSTAGNAEDILVTPGRFSNVVIEEVEQST